MFIVCSFFVCKEQTKNMPAQATGAIEEKEAFTQMLENAAVPIDLRKSEVVFGAVEYVAIEVFVSWMIRYMFKFEKKGLMELAAIHAISLPLIGGAVAFVEDTHLLGYEAPWGDVVYDGAKGIPAVFVSQYMVNTALAGFHVPGINFKDILITVASKVLSRVMIAGAFYPNFGQAFRTYLDILDETFRTQHAKSRLKTDS